MLLIFSFEVSICKHEDRHILLVAMILAILVRLQMLAVKTILLVEEGKNMNLWVMWLYSWGTNHQQLSTIIMLAPTQPN